SRISPYRPHRAASRRRVAPLDRRAARRDCAGWTRGLDPRLCVSVAGQRAQTVWLSLWQKEQILGCQSRREPGKVIQFWKAQAETIQVRWTTLQAMPLILQRLVRTHHRVRELVCETPSTRVRLRLWPKSCTRARRDHVPGEFRGAGPKAKDGR